MVIINARTMSPEAIAEAKAFAEKENLCGVVRWIGGAFFYRESGSQVLLLVFCDSLFYFSVSSSSLSFNDEANFNREAEKRTKRKKKVAARGLHFSFHTLWGGEG